jgi:hypothetical protein
MAMPERLAELVPNAVENERTNADDALTTSRGVEPIQVNFGEVFEIRDLRNHSAATLITLALLLAGTVEVRPDPKRKNFYEVAGGSEAYYIHVSPNGIIYLLAVWQQSNAERRQAGKEHRVTPMISPSLWRSASPCAPIPT